MKEAEIYVSWELASSQARVGQVLGKIFQGLEEQTQESLRWKISVCGGDVAAERAPSSHTAEKDARHHGCH